MEISLTSPILGTAIEKIGTQKTNEDPGDDPLSLDRALLHVPTVNLQAQGGYGPGLLVDPVCFVGYIAMVQTTTSTNEKKKLITGTFTKK